MAVTIAQQPTIPNMANADLLFAISSNKSDEPQFQYICDIYESDGTTLIQRIKQQPNPQGQGIFNIRQIISYQLDSDKVWKAAPFSISDLSHRHFRVKFGEEYGTSVSSSVTLYNGINDTPNLAPAKTGSAFYAITNGLVEHNSGQWNFDSASYYTETTTPTLGGELFQLQHCLTSAPLQQKIDDGDYLTLSIYNGNFDYTDDLKAQDIYLMQVNVFDATGTPIQNISLYNIESLGGGPRTVYTETWDQVNADQYVGLNLLHLGVGPQNLADAGYTLDSDWASYEVILYANEDSGFEDVTCYYAYRTFVKQPCDINKVRFAWKNEFGCWDYFTFTKNETISTSVERQDFLQTNIPWSDQQAGYDITKRGRNQFNNKLTQQKQVYSDWITLEQSVWLNELFYSTDVYIQVGTDFIPVVITNASVTERSWQKMFNYQLTYQVSNQLRNRL